MAKRNRGFRWVLFVAAVVSAGIVVHSPALGTGYLMDDHLQNAMLDGTYPVPRGPLNLYDFVRPPDVRALVQAGTLPWWSHPGLQISALRPLASALVVLDHRVLALSPFGRHLHSLLWWAALVTAFAALSRELLPVRAAAFATAVFALGPSHVMPVSWLANRTALVSAVFGVLALLAHVRFREPPPASSAGGAHRMPWLSAVWVALALASGEYGLSVLPYLVSYELFRARGPLGERALALLPAAVPAGIYLVLYVALGYGPSASSMYVSPLGAPLEFLRHAAVRFPALLLNQWWLVPAEFTSDALLRHYAGWIVPVAAPLAAVGVLVASRSRTSFAPVLPFLLGGTVFALVPLVGTFPSTRLLLVPSIGSSAIVGALLSEAIEHVEIPRPRVVVRWLGGLVVALLGVVHLVVGPASSAFFSAQIRDGVAFLGGLSRDAELDDARVASEDVILLNASDPTALLYLPKTRLEQRLHAPRTYRALAMTLGPLHVRRPSRDVLELFVDRGSLTDNPLASVLRREDLPLAEGEHFELSGLTVDVLSVTPSGPQRVRFRTLVDLDAGPTVLLVASSSGFRRVSPAVGTELVVPGIAPSPLAGP